MVPNGVSVVTTTWNERDNVEKLVSTIRRTLQNLPHEIIIVDDSSSDGTIHIAKLLADIAVTKPREGQTKGLLYGMQIAKYPTIITIDADLENDPTHIPNPNRALANGNSALRTHNTVESLRKSNEHRHT